MAISSRPSFRWVSERISKGLVATSGLVLLVERLSEIIPGTLFPDRGDPPQTEAYASPNAICVY